MRVAGTKTWGGASASIGKHQPKTKYLKIANALILSCYALSVGSSGVTAMDQRSPARSQAQKIFIGAAKVG